MNHGRDTILITNTKQKRVTNTTREDEASMHADEFHVDEIRFWAWMSAATVAAIIVTAIVFAPVAKVRVATEAAPPPPLTVPTVVPPLTAEGRA